RRAVLSLEEDSKTGARVIDPIRIEIKNSVFLNPFVRDNGKTPATAAVLVAPESALWRGALLWRSDGDAFDSRLRAYVLPAGADGSPKLDAPQPFAAWQRFWGPLGAKNAITDLPFRNIIHLEKLELDQLVCPPHPTHPGADLVRLGIIKGKKKL